GAVVVRWDLGDAGELVLEANLSDEAVEGFPARAGRELWCENRGDAGHLAGARVGGSSAAGSGGTSSGASDSGAGDTRLRPWMVRWSLQDQGDRSVGSDVGADRSSALEQLAERMGI